MTVTATCYAVSTGWHRSIKYNRLMDELSDSEIDEHAPMCVMRLWAYCAESRKHGVLSGLSDKEIARMAGWRKDKTPEEFVDAIIRVGLFERTDGTVRVHDWEYWQEYLILGIAYEQGSREKKLDEAERIGNKNAEKRKSKGLKEVRKERIKKPKKEKTEIWNDPEPISKGIHGENDVDRVNFERDRRLEKQVEADYRDNPPEDDLSF